MWFQPDLKLTPTGDYSRIVDELSVMSPGRVDGGDSQIAMGWWLINLGDSGAESEAASCFADR